MYGYDNFYARKTEEKENIFKKMQLSTERKKNEH